MHFSTVARALCLLALLFAGCAPPLRPSFRLIGAEFAPVLEPPESPLRVHLRRGSAADACGVAAPLASLTWHKSLGRRPEARLQIGPLLQSQMGPVARARALDAFRLAILARLQRGCFDGLTSDALLSALASSEPMSPDAAFSLRYGAAAASGYADLVAGFHLQEVTLIRAGDGAIRGQRTRLFAVAARGRGAIAVRPLGRPQSRWYFHDLRAKEPPGLPFSEARAAGYWRLFLWLTAAPGSHAVIVAAATTRSALDEISRVVQLDPERCARLSAAGRWCWALSRDTVLTIEIPVKIQGRRAYEPFYSRAAEAIHAAGISDPRSVLPSLRVWRSVNGRPTPIAFDRRSGAILFLRLMAGDQLRW